MYFGIRIQYAVFSINLIDGLGVVLCILFCAWFISGIVMIYHPFPSLSEELRLQRAESITTNSTLLPIHKFWSENLLNLQKITLVSVLDEPYYWWYVKDNKQDNYSTCCHWNSSRV